MTKLTTLALTLALSLLPAMAQAVELSGEIVEVETVSVLQDATASWEAHLRQERAARLQSLRAYAAAGNFPRKPGVPGWHHQFLDANNTPCAVAHLIASSGHMDLVQATAATRNDVELAQLQGGPLIDWVATSGLTIEEIAFIQEPGFEEEFALQPVPEPPVDPGPAQLVAAQAEQQRIRTHLAAALTLLEADTESSIAKAMSRLGERTASLPPSARVAALR